MRSLSTDVVHNHIHQKEYYGYQKRHVAVADDGIVAFEIKAVNKHMHLIVTVDAGGDAYLDSYAGTTYTDESTEGSVYNRYVDDAPASDGKIIETPTVNVLGSLRFNKYIPGGTGPLSSGASGGNSRVETVLAPSNNLYVIVTNKSGAVKDLGITVEWYEV